MSLDDLIKKHKLVLESAEPTERPGDAILNTRDSRLVGAIAAGFAPVVRDVLSRTILPVLEELEKAQARLAVLEARPGLKYQGVWDKAKRYDAGTFVTDQGSLWHANTEARGVRPGDGNIWTLVVKKGVDGKAVK
jgi:hypothetical protein